MLAVLHLQGFGQQGQLRGIVERHGTVNDHGGVGAGIHGGGLHVAALHLIGIAELARAVIDPDVLASAAVSGGFHGEAALLIQGNVDDLIAGCKGNTVVSAGQDRAQLLLVGGDIQRQRIAAAQEVVLLRFLQNQQAALEGEVQIFAVIFAAAGIHHLKGEGVKVGDHFADPVGRPGPDVEGKGQGGQLLHGDGTQIGGFRSAGLHL